MGKTFKDDRDHGAKHGHRRRSRRPPHPRPKRKLAKPVRPAGTMPGPAAEQESYRCIGPGSARGLGPDTTTMRVGPPADENRRAEERRRMIKAGMAPHVSGDGRWGEAE